MYTSFPRPLVFESLFAGAQVSRQQLWSFAGAGSAIDTLRWDAPMPAKSDPWTLCNCQLAVKEVSPDSRMNVQMLDGEEVNNNLYHDFQRNCEETDEQSAMALDLRVDQRIYMSGALAEGLDELATP